MFPRRTALILVVLLLESGASHAGPGTVWVPSWTASLYELAPDARLSDAQFTDATLRQSVRLSIGGPRIKIVLSNKAGHAPLVISGVQVALSGPSGTADIVPSSDREVRFDHRSGVVVPAGREAISDAVELQVASLARLSISMHVVTPPDHQTGHMRALSSTWVIHGIRLHAATLATAASAEHWYNLAAVLVDAPDPHLLVAFGDSITDGSRSRVNGNQRWTDFFAERLQRSPATRHWAVANQGIAGSCLLTDGYGSSGLARFDQDVLSQPHARTAIILIGINDLGQFGQTRPTPETRREFVTRISAAYQELISRARAHGLKVIGATLTPYNGSDYSPTALDDGDRRAINEWIRTPGHFDALIDWDAVMRDPDDAGRLRPEFDSGDHLHPSPAGYRAMADSIPIDILIK